MITVLILIIQFAPNNNDVTNNELKFVTVTLQGGLGNQMFQLATAISYSKRTNKRFIMNTNISELVGLSTRKTYWDKIHMQHDDKIDSYNWHEIKEESFAFKELPNISEHVKLTGYFQSARYFENDRIEIISRFVKDFDIREDTVSVHIRRTDYIGLNFYAELNKEYYHSAIRYIQSFYHQSLKLLVFSDDLEWVQKSKWFEHPEFNAQFYDEPGDYEQLIAMSQCRHHIMANSSYSWWAVFLGDQSGITVSPKQWFVDLNIATNDLYLPNWVKM
jgi:hypothetical protein